MARSGYVAYVRRDARALIAAAVAVVVLGVAGGAGEGRSFVIRASSTFMRLGDYWIDKDPTYAGAVAALGPSSSCRLVHGDVSHGLASWRALGIVIELRTYGGLPQAKTACTAPRFIRVHTVRVIDKRWTTARGLRVGDTVSRLRHSYPSAKAAHGLTGWYERGYWLVTRWVGGYEGIGGLRPTVPVLVAETSRGRVSGFVLVVDAEGD